MRKTNVDLQIDRDNLASSLYRELARAIADGRLRPGEALPPSRELAATLAVSRTTVTTAYERLVSEDYARATVGSGTFVADRAPSLVRTARQGAIQPRRAWPSPTVARPQNEFDFGIGSPDVTLFPLADWRRAMNAELNSPRTLPPRYGDVAGLPRLREAIARHIGLSRAVFASADDIIVTAGSQQAIDLVARTMTLPGDTIAVEEPGYPPVRALFESHGVTVVSVPVDEHGIRVNLIPPAARLVYTTPSHQFPTGVVMSLERRRALLDWASANNAAIIEDDYDSEFRYTGRPLEPLQSLDAVGRVIYIGTFSKSLLPALRMGFIVAPASIVEPLRAAKRFTDRHGDLVSQGALASLIDSGAFARHLRRARKQYAVRRDAILGAGLDVIPSQAGLHVCVRLPGRAEEVVLAAAAAGLALETLAAYCADEPQHGIVVGFGLIQPHQLDEGLRRLVTVVGRA